MAEAEKTEAQIADDAFNLVAHALNLAMGGKFPTGMEHLELHMQVRGAQNYIGSILKRLYPEVVPSDGPQEQGTAAPAPAGEAEAPAEAPEPAASN